MNKTLRILWNSFLMALQELRVNKLRTFLSLFGVTIGIFCIVSVLALVNSLQAEIRSELDEMGSNMINVSKWQWMNSNDYPWWKFINRPEVKYSEFKFLQQNSKDAQAMYYFTMTTTTLSYKNNTYNANLYGVSEEFNQIQNVDVAAGRYMTSAEFTRGMPVCVIGDEIATQLFQIPERAVGKQINFNNNKVTVLGVIKKQGQIINAFQFDQSMIIPHYYFTTLYNEDNLDPDIFVKAKAGISNAELTGELHMLMRQVRRLNPTQDDNFALNDVDMFREVIEKFFGVVNEAGWAIAGVSLLVGGFGIANIMFVTVRERRSQIGLKKAIGAKSATILWEFLLESAFLCILGGLIGLLLVWVLSMIISAIFPFHMFVALKIIVLAFSICIALGVVSGIVPASVAAKLNPVVAIRSN